MTIAPGSFVKIASPAKTPERNKNSFFRFGALKAQYARANAKNVKTDNGRSNQIRELVKLRMGSKAIPITGSRRVVPLCDWKYLRQKTYHSSLRCLTLWYNTLCYTALWSVPLWSITLCFKALGTPVTVVLLLDLWLFGLSNFWSFNPYPLKLSFWKHKY